MKHTSNLYSPEFIRNGIVLFLTEFVKGAFLVSFFPVYAVNSLGLSLAEVGTVVSVFYLADNLFKCIAGYLVNRFSVSLIVNGGFFLSMFGIAALMNVHSLPLLIIASALIGIGGSPVWIVLLSQVQDGQRASQMGVLYLFWIAGLGAGPVLINFVMDRSMNLSTLLLFVIWGAGWLLASRIRNADMISPVSLPVQAAILWKRLRKMRFLLPGMIIQTTAAGMLVPVISGFATRHIGLTHSEFSLLMIVGGACIGICLIPFGKWSDRRGGKWFLVGGSAIFSIVLLSLTFVSTLKSAIAASALLGISYAAVLPAWNALLAGYVPKRLTGTAWGLFSAIEGLGVMIGPIIGGILADRYNEKFPFFASSLLFIVLSVIYMMSPSTRFAHNRRLNI
ncbi:MFS transporter [Paenibacillus beijingensis]|uniref:Major facilitator superfamily (MFS) profile domain-containing protein n=1 Tax=Paenibacillus beijingensis TaxID=1126833 RepID=A0A0D5NNZ4_9BACL|nr:MFS transporter [Paenibacillus beijingensis]AJY76717.1 hypothetical protein VN24_21785 [Paenibacillus beijingensis]